MRPLLLFLCCLGFGRTIATAQVVAPTTQLAPVASLSDQLANRLKATTAGRQAFVREVVRRTEIGQLDPRLVLAVQRYAIRRNPEFPFPFFERALRFQAAKLRVTLPEVQTFLRPGESIR